MPLPPGGTVEMSSELPGARSINAERVDSALLGKSDDDEAAPLLCGPTRAPRAPTLALTRMSTRSDDLGKGEHVAAKSQKGAPAHVWAAAAAVLALVSAVSVALVGVQARA